MDMADDAASEGAPRPLLTLGRVERVQIQVGYRALPDSPADRQFLLDIEVPEDDGRGQNSFDDARILATLEPVLCVGGDVRRHYSLHQHRSHTSWGLSPGALEIGILVTTGTRSVAHSEAAYDGVIRAFRDLLEMAGVQDPPPISRAAAIMRARSSAGTAFAVHPDELTLRTEEHHPATNSWRVGLRATHGDEYDVMVGVVGGYVGAVRVTHVVRSEVSDSVGSE